MKSTHTRPNNAPHTHRQVVKADRPVHAQKGESRAVESPRAEFPVLGLQNGVKYSFLPCVKVGRGCGLWSSDRGGK